MGHVSGTLPERTRAEVIEYLPSIRQSLLAKYDNCYLSARFDLESDPHTSHRAASGIIFHRTAAEILRTLRRTGETRMPTEEALQILYEQSAQRDVSDEEVVIVPAKERRLLRIAIVKLIADNDFRMRRLIDIERRLYATVTYDAPDGEVIERMLTGQPDALLADPATPDDPVSGAVILDWKMSLGVPPKGDSGDHADDPAHVSYAGYYQQRFYGLLVLRSFPSVDRVQLREYYALQGVARYATIYRSDLEHLEREFSIQAELLDRALMGGSRSAMWKPSPGKHCAFCSRPTSCSILPEARIREGGVSSQAQAEKIAEEYVLFGQIRKNHHTALKNWVDIHGPVTVKSAKGVYVVRWKTNKGGGRSFGVHVELPSDRLEADPTLDAVFSGVGERAKRAA